MKKFESLAAKILPANITRKINKKANRVSNFTDKAESYTSTASTIAKGAKAVKPITSTVKTINNVTEIVNKPAKVLLNRAVNTVSSKVGNPLSSAISSSTKVDGQHTANFASSQLSKPTGNWVSEKLVGVATGINNMPSFGLIREANPLSSWWWFSQASNVSEIVADNAELIHQTEKLAGTVNHYASETNKAFNRIINKQEQPGREMEYHTLSQKVVYSEDDEEIIVDKFNNWKESYTQNSLKSFVDNEEEIIVIANKDEILWEDSRSWTGQIINGEELFGNEEQDREEVRERISKQKKLEEWERIEDKLEINEEYEDVKSEVEEAESWQPVSEEEIEKETDKEWFEFEEAVRIALEKSKVFKVVEKASSGLNSARKIFQGIEKTVPKIQEDFILRNATPVVVKNIADYIAKNVGCGTEIAARYIEEVTVDNEKFAEFLNRVKETAASVDYYINKVKKTTDKVASFSRGEEYNALNNLPSLYSANESLKSSHDKEFEGLSIIDHKEPSTGSEELLMLMPGAFNNDAKAELFGNEETKEPQLEIAIEEEQVEKIINSIPGAWDYAPQKDLNISQQQHLVNNLTEAMKEGEEEEKFYDALEEQEDNKEENSTISHQQKAVVEVRNPFFSNKFKGFFNCLTFPLIIK